MQNKWFEDKENVLKYISYLSVVGRHNIIQDVIKHPEKYTRDYETYLIESENLYAIQKQAQTQEFFDERFYPINGDWYESITTILWAYPSPFITQLVAQIGTVEAELRKTIAAEKGSKVHDALQHGGIIKREDYTDDEWLCLIHAKLFLDEYKPKTIINEEWVWSSQFHFAGRIDKVYLMNDKVTLIDWKTGYIKNEHWLQLAAEKLAIEEMHPLKIERWGIVGLNTKHIKGWNYYDISERGDVSDAIKSGVDVEKAIDNAYQDDIQVFHHLHEVWKHAFRSVKPKRYPFAVVPDELNITTESVDNRKEVYANYVEKFKEANIPIEANQIMIDKGKVENENVKSNPEINRLREEAQIDATFTDVGETHNDSENKEPADLSSSNTQVTIEELKKLYDGLNDKESFYIDFSNDIVKLSVPERKELDEYINQNKIKDMQIVKKTNGKKSNKKNKGDDEDAGI